MEKSGKTTRKVDQAIQDLLLKGMTYLHEGIHKDVECHIHIFTVFIERLKAEHPNTKYTYEFNYWDGIWCYKIETHDL